MAVQDLQTTPLHVRVVADVHARVAIVTRAVLKGDDAIPHRVMRAAPHNAVAEVVMRRSEEHTSELQSHSDLVCRLLLEKKKISASCRGRSSLSPASSTALARYHRR